MILRDTIEVHASPADVFAFFEDMDTTRYLGWHPDHKAFRWTRGKGLRVGNEFYFEEVIAGKLLKKHVVFTRIDEGARIEFTPTSRLMRLFLPRLVFRIERMAEHRYRFIAEIFLRVGPLAARLKKREFEAVREHMRVEGINLKRSVESRREHAADRQLRA
ncbi:MAG TPA: SRPBCC family protein [Methylomirabilota bacterium]|jgi:hypothetical protein